MQGLRLSTLEMDRLSGSEVKNLLRERKLVLILDLDHTLINSTRLHDISAAEMDLGIQSAASKSKLYLLALNFENSCCFYTRCDIL